MISEKKDIALVKKIFSQESKTKQFYSDEMPLVAFDNGYGMGQLTNPAPTFEQIWSWKKHIEEILIVRIPYHRKRAKNYLDDHKDYTDDMLDLETLVSYIGIPKQQRYHNWDEKSKKWVLNSDVICEPNQSNKGWLITEKENDKQSLTELRDNSKSKPMYTGRCYAEHIKATQ